MATFSLLKVWLGILFTQIYLLANKYFGVQTCPSPLKLSSAFLATSYTLETMRETVKVQ